MSENVYREISARRRRSFVSEDAGRKLDKLIANIDRYAILFDNPTEEQIDGFDFVPGVGMHTESERFRQKSDELRRGVFKILIMGKFKNGKSTFINAFIGRATMATKTTACTAVIATVEYGKDIDNVKVVYTEESQLPPRVMPIAEFQREFKLTPEDDRIIKAGGIIERFADVDHVEMQTDAEIFADGLTMIDSPGLEDRASCTKATLNFVPQANAIIFLLNAKSLFSEEERDYIATNFERKHADNIFFVINQFDLVPKSDRAEVMSKVRINLEDVFSDADGNFDEELYKRRVFPLSAHRALCARLNEPYDEIELNGQTVPLRAKLEDTGLLEFGGALWQFLNSDDRINALIGTTLRNMATSYQKAVQKVADDKKFRALDIEEREKRAQAAKKYLNAARQTIKDGEKAAHNRVDAISTRIFNSLLDFIDEELPERFEEHVRNEEVRATLGLSRILKLMGVGIIGFFKKDYAKKRAREILTPFVERVNAYVNDQIKMWSNGVSVLVRSEMLDMSSVMSDMLRKFNVEMNGMRNVLVTGFAVAVANEYDDAVSSTITPEKLFPDAGQILEEKFTEELSATFISHGMSLVFLVFMSALFNGIFFIVKMLIKLVMELELSTSKDVILSQMGNVVFRKLHESIEEQRSTIKQRLNEPFDKKIGAVVSAADSIMNDAEKNLDRLLRADDRNSAAVQNENERADRVLAEMRACIGAVYSEIHQHEPTEEEFNRLLVEARG